MLDDEPPEPPDDEVPPDDDVPLDALAAGAAVDELPDDVVDVLALLDVPEPPDEPPDLLLEDAYKSAYQPPPFRMKLPPLIWRLAVA